MGIFTAFMISLTEYSQVASISIILVLFSLMLAYILRLVSLDLLNGFPGGVVRITNHVPRINMEAKKLDWTMKVISYNNQLLKLECNVQEQVRSLIFRAYWGVDINAYHHILRSPWSWFIPAFENGNLFGSENCLRLDAMQEKANSLDDEPIVVEFQCPTLELGPTPRTKYPLVLVSTIKSANEDSYPVFNFHVIHLGDSMLFNTHILNHFLKWPSRVTNLVPIYSETSCVICITSNATRVVLPCRHANLCRACFKKLPHKKCPMCRRTISSYFLFQNEDNQEEEEESNEEMLITPPLTWRQRLAEFEHRFAMAVGLQEND